MREFKFILMQEMAMREMTIEELAKYLHVHKNTMSNWLHGKSEPSLSTALSVLATLGYEWHILKNS